MFKPHYFFSSLRYLFTCSCQVHWFFSFSMTFSPQISVYHPGLPCPAPGRAHSATHLLTSCSSNLQVMAVKLGTWLPNQGLLRRYFGPVQPQPQLCLQTLSQYGASPFFRPAPGWESALPLLSSSLIPPSMVKSCTNHQVLSGFLMYFFGGWQHWSPENVGM